MTEESYFSVVIIIVCTWSSVWLIMMFEKLLQSSKMINDIGCLYKVKVFFKIRFVGTPLPLIDIFSQFMPDRIDVHVINQMSEIRIRINDLSFKVLNKQTPFPFVY